MYGLSILLLPFFLMGLGNAEAGQPGSVEKAPPESSAKEPVKKRYELYKGRRYDLCRNYLALMHRVPVNPREKCDLLRHSFDKTAREQGFREIRWTEVEDVQAHKEMIKMSNYHALVYWRRKDFSEEWFEEFMKSRPRLWRTTMDLNFDGHKEVVYKLSGMGSVCNADRNRYFIYDARKPYSQFSLKSGTNGIHGDLFYYKGRPYNSSHTFGTHPLDRSKENYRGSITETYGGDKYVNVRSICYFRFKQN